MLSDFKGADKVYIACGYTDLRKGIDGLALLVRQITHQQYRWLMEGLKVEQPKAHRPVDAYRKR